jgi:hypothetical protein
MDTSIQKMRWQSIRELWSFSLKPLNWDVFCKKKTNKILNSRNMGCRPNPGNKGEPIASNVFLKSAYMDAIDGITRSSSTMELW